MSVPITMAWVALGGGVGASLRWLVSHSMAGWSLNFPLATMSVNILGSLLMGVLAGAMAHTGPWPDWVRPFVMIGLLGGFTTFSSFSLDAWVLLERQQWGLAALYMVGSVLLCVLGLVAGMMIARGLFHG